MDLAIYINELLGLRGEVNVPGVGYFTQKRVAGYYNESEKKLYPPRHEIVFNPEPRDDDELARYISKKKNISPASAKYFIEKYTAGLKQKATQGVDITGLGQLYYEYSTLTFSTDKKSGENTPSFYGFAPVRTSKATGQAAGIEASSIVVPPHAIKAPPEDEYKPIVPTPPVIGKKPDVIAPPPVVEPEAENAPADVTFSTTKAFVPHQVFEEEPDHRARNIWIVVLLTVIIVLLLFGIAYQYNPGLFSPNSKEDTVVIVKTLPAGVRADSVARKDTTAKSLAPAQTISRAIDTFAVVRYEILGGAFPTEGLVNTQMKRYQKMGLNPRILEHATGKLYKITLGTFFTESRGIDVRDSILKATGINAKDIYLQRYIPKK